MATDRLSAMYGKFTAVKDVSLGFVPNGEVDDGEVVLVLPL